METYSVDCVVIGAGVIGLACARELALAGREVVCLEAEPAFGTQTSSRNSEVIHAGLYYPPGSIKAQACVEGRRALYAYCESRSVGHAKCGKLVVACTADEAARLSGIAARAKENGVEGVAFMEGARAREMEPALSPDVSAALFSPETGIIDSHGLMLALLGDLESAGGRLALSSPVLGGEVAETGGVLEIGGAAPARLKARTVVNAAGLSASRLLGRIRGFPADKVPETLYAKGSYFAVSGRSPFQRLIYPTPIIGGLGVHLTFDLGGAMRFGPDAQWVEDPNDLEVDPARAEGFYAAIRTYWPGLPDGALRPDYAGMRPKLYRPGQPSADFRIDGEAEHGLPGWVNLFGIESPGLTACLACSGRVAAKA